MSDGFNWSPSPTGQISAAIEASGRIILPKMKPTAYVSHMHAYGNTTTTTASLALNTLVASPVCVAEAITITHLSLDLTVVAAGNIRLGIGLLDADGGTWNLLDMLLDTGGAAIPGVAGPTTQVAAFTFDPGVFYGLLALSDATVTMRAFSGSTDLFGSTVATGALVARCGLSNAHTYGALPETKTFLSATTIAPMILGLVA